MRGKSWRRSGLGGEESLTGNPAVHLGRLCSLQSRADVKSNCGSFGSLRCLLSLRMTVPVTDQAVMRKRPSCMICSVSASGPEPYSSQMLKASPTTSMCVDERQGAPVCSP